MKNKVKLAILSVLLITSILPLMYFFAYDYPNAGTYIRQLFWGQAFVDINVAKDSFMIVSLVVLGLWSTQLSHVLVVIGSIVVFCVCLALISRIFYKNHINKKKGLTRQQMKDEKKKMMRVRSFIGKKHRRY